MRVNLSPAFILHTRPYKETSLLLHILTRDYGKIQGLARGVKRQKSNIQGLVRPFIPLKMSWSGKTDLLNIHQIEATGHFYPLSGRQLISGIYLNEILMRLLHQYDAQPQIYHHYAHTLRKLHHYPTQLQSTLRKFEFDLLNHLGFGLQLHVTHDTNQPVRPQTFYRVEPFKGVTTCYIEGDNYVFIGKSLLQIHARIFQDTQTLYDAKCIIRLLWQQFFRDKPLQSYALLH